MPPGAPSWLEIADFQITVCYGSGSSWAEPMTGLACQHPGAASSCG